MKRNDALLTLRLPARELEKIQDEAMRCGMTASNYVRKKIGGSTEVLLPEEVRNLLQELRGSLLKIGVNINQIARSVNTKGSIREEERRELLDYMSRLEAEVGCVTKAVEEYFRKRQKEADQR